VFIDFRANVHQYTIHIAKEWQVKFTIRKTLSWRDYMDASWFLYYFYFALFSYLAKIYIND